ncbi:hypothetical protein [Xanthomonas translucens]|nr:hypothetical protein [Xanthomonas translucens]MCS3359511.1 hypothetical protein [Xanthomonas translucens pv. translucens]MCT8289038.1 hypothetical protein [Xanthomonas translucens pv. translucens]MCT8312825.1 hypothetical protein [Xanthomonas translucens pv. translucens]MCT8320216.1 hypothetical protein [Xanthomonas translucens pv. translucens]
MKARWGKALQQDPYYNVNLTVESTPFTLAYPPRPWEPQSSGRALA